MTARTRRTLAWVIFVTTCVGLAIQGWFAWLMRDLPEGGGWSGNTNLLQGLLFVAMILSFSITGLLIALRRPENPLGWLLLAIGGAWGLSTGNYGLYSVLVRPLPFGIWALAWDQWTWVPAVGLIGTYTILLFPDGHLPSPRWHWLGRLIFATLVLASIAVLFSDTPIEVTKSIHVDDPLGIPALRPVLEPLFIFVALVPICMVASAVGLVVRFRRSKGVERQQMKWLAWAGGSVAVLYLIVMAVSLPHAFTSRAQPAWLDTVQAYTIFIFTLIPVSIGFAVLRYRLYDIDVVISKTVMVGLLVGFITVVYVAVVVGIGSLLGDPRNPALSIAATAVVALLFGPVRERVRRFANRLVYGKRATPYEVMSGFAHRVSGSLSVDQILPEMAEVAAKGVGAIAARVRVTLPHGAERSRSWPHDAVGPFTRSFDVTYQGDTVGAIDIAVAAADPVPPGEERLLADLASQAGLALHNVRLTEELAIRAEELAVQAEGLRVSRERLVTARDAQRRGLERDIHEGPERQLGEIRGALGMVDMYAPSAATELDALTVRANDTLEGLRDLARGIFPPLLADKGVMAALEAHIRKVGALARLEAASGFAETRYDPGVEACIYFCCLQAIQNVMRHGGGATCTVTLADEGARLSVLIVDDGPGFDPAQASAGMGMQIMQDRVDASDGELAVASAPGQGTTVRIKVPARVEVPA